MGFISASRSQGRLFGYSLEDFVEPEAKVRQIVGWTERLDLAELYADYSRQGGDALDPRILLATWFFAYSEGITSTRKLEALCKRDMHFIYASAQLQPDHTSLSRFRKRHTGRLPDLFAQIVRLSAEDGVSDFGLIAIDGTKMEARASGYQNRTSGQLAEQLGKVREQIAAYLQQCDLMDEPEEAESVQDVRRRIERLEQLERKLLERQEALAQRKTTLQSKDRSKHQINVVEPEARNMNAVNGKRSAPGYNAQIGVDTGSGLIVSQDVTDHPTDQRQFSRQYDNAEKNLPQDSHRTYVADAGYSSLGQLDYIEQQRVDAILADPRPEHRDGQSSSRGHRYTRSAFRYDPQRDCYHCPGGQALTYWYKEHRRGHTEYVYRCQACSDCPKRSKCLHPKAKHMQRTIRRDEREHLAEAMSLKSRSEQGKQALAVRRQTVEPAIGNIKANLGFRRFCVHGLQSVRGEFALMCIAHNLNKLFSQLGGRLRTYLLHMGLLRRVKCLWDRLLRGLNIAKTRFSWIPAWPRGY